MIDPALLREHPEVIARAVQQRGGTIDLPALRSLDQRFRAALKETEALRAAAHQQAPGAPDPAERAARRTEKERLKLLEATLRELKAEYERRLVEIPNIPAPDVPVGPGETSNVVLRTVGAPPTFGFPAKDYLELAAAHDLIDLDRAGKVAGARFAYLKNEAALLSFALVRYGLAICLNEGFTPIIPPVLINEAAMAGMGYLEHGGEDETYHFTPDQLYLVGTSEQAIGPMHADEILEPESLPRRYVGFSSCFRREAGSYGRDTRGILRVHQFDKLEMFSLTVPSQADAEHEYLLSLQERFVADLKLPYRVVKLCTGDLGAPSARTYDIETWIPSQQTYRETHSTSTTTDFQARRLKIRYRQKNGSTALVHMLNGTMVAVNRPLIAILENYQQSDGSVLLPEVLQPHCFGKTRIG